MFAAVVIQLPGTDFAAPAAIKHHADPRSTMGWAEGAKTLQRTTTRHLQAKKPLG